MRLNAYVLSRRLKPRCSQLVMRMMIDTRQRTASQCIPVNLALVQSVLTSKCSSSQQALLTILILGIAPLFTSLAQFSATMWRHVPLILPLTNMSGFCALRQPQESTLWLTSLCTIHHAGVGRSQTLFQARISPWLGISSELLGMSRVSLSTSKSRLRRWPIMVRALLALQWVTHLEVSTYYPHSHKAIGDADFLFSCQYSWEEKMKYTFDSTPTNKQRCVGLGHTDSGVPTLTNGHASDTSEVTTSAWGSSPSS